LRDLDVVADDIVRREAAAQPDEPELAALADALSQEAAERRRHLRACLAGARMQAFLIDLAKFVEPAAGFCRRILARPSGLLRRSPTSPKAP
jgi:triphosphatase